MINKKIYSILIIILYNLSLINTELHKSNVVLAVNCGGKSYKDPRGIEYEEDNYYDGGQSSDFGKHFGIKNTDSPDLYQTERWSDKDLTYSLPIGEGRFVVILKFSEVYFNNPSEKIFNVFIGNTKILESVDVFDKVGKATAYDEYIEIEIKNGKVYVDKKTVDGGLIDDKLQVIFKKGEKDNPKINSILVVRGGIDETDYKEYILQLDEFQKEQVEKEKKQREIKKRNSLHYDFEEFEDEFNDFEHLRKSSIFNSFFLVILSLIFGGGYIFIIRPLKKID